MNLLLGLLLFILICQIIESIRLFVSGMFYTPPDYSGIKTYSTLEKSD